MRSLTQPSRPGVKYPGRGKSSGVRHALSIKLPQLAQSVEFPHMGSGLLFARTTGLKVWPASEAIAHLLLTCDVLERAALRHPSLGSPFSLAGLRVVELGAGLGLCSVAAAAAGAQVVATDGDPDLTRLLKKNLTHNWARLKHSNPKLSQVVPPRAALLPWGDESALAKLDLPVSRRDLPTNPTGLDVDVVLLADCIYGSNPGVWQRLIDTLRALVGPLTLVIQAESPRIEGVLYGEYWSMLSEAGFHSQQIWPVDERPGQHPGDQPPIETELAEIADTASVKGVKMWVIHRPSLT